MQTKFIALIAVLLLPLLIGCSNSDSKKSGQVNNNEKPIPLSDILENPEQYEDKEISVSGLCIHTCRRSGKRLFLQGKNNKKYLLVTASGDISKFDSDLEGTEVLTKGYLKKQNELEEGHHHDKEEEGCENENRAMNFKLEATHLDAIDDH